MKLISVSRSLLFAFGLLVEHSFAHADAIGAVVGGAVGAQFGKGNGRIANAAIGAVIGDRLSSGSGSRWGGAEYHASGRHVYGFGTGYGYSSGHVHGGRRFAGGHRHHHHRFGGGHGYIPAPVQYVYTQPAAVVHYQQPPVIVYERSGSFYAPASQGGCVQQLPYDAEPAPSAAPVCPMPPSAPEPAPRYPNPFDR